MADIGTNENQIPFPQTGMRTNHDVVAGCKKVVELLVMISSNFRKSSLDARFISENTNFVLKNFL